jgi:hypothetical protein
VVAGSFFDREVVSLLDGELARWPKNTFRVPTKRKEKKNLAQ